MSSDVFETLKTLRQTDLWDYFDESDLVAIQLPKHRDPSFISLFEEEDSVGISIYRNYADVSYIFELSKQLLTHGQVYDYDMSVITIYFENREDISNESYRRIKASGTKFRGKKQWPQIIDFHPDYEPMLLETADYAWLQDILLAFLDVAENIMMHDVFAHIDENRAVYPGRQYFMDKHYEDRLFTLPDYVLRGITEQTYDIKPVLVTHFEILRLKSLPQAETVWELKVEKSGQLAKEKDNERGFYPLACALVDCSMEQAIDIAVFRPDDDEIIQRALLRILISYGYRPSQINVVSRYYYRMSALLGEFFKQVGIKIHAVDELTVTPLVEKHYEIPSLFYFLDDDE